MDTEYQMSDGEADYFADLSQECLSPKDEEIARLDGMLNQYRSSLQDAEHFTISVRRVEDEHRVEAVRESSAYLARLTRRALTVKALYDDIEAERRRVAEHVERLKNPVIEDVLADFFDPDAARLEQLGGKTTSNDAAVSTALTGAPFEGYDIEMIVTRLGTHPIVAESTNPAKVVANHLSSMVQRRLAIRVGRGRYRLPLREDPIPF